MPMGMGAGEQQRRHKRLSSMILDGDGGGGGGGDGDDVDDAGRSVNDINGEAVWRRRRNMEQTLGIESMFGRRSFSSSSYLAGQRNSTAALLRPFEYVAPGVMAQSDPSQAAARAIMTAAAQNGLLSSSASSSLPFDIHHHHERAASMSLVPYNGNTRGAENSNSSSDCGDDADDADDDVDNVNVVEGRNPPPDEEHQQRQRQQQRAGDRVHIGEGEVLERAPGNGEEAGGRGGGAAAVGSASLPGVTVRVGGGGGGGSLRPPKNYLPPPTRRHIETIFGTPGVDDECFICERNSSTMRGLPAPGVQRLMEAFQELDGQEHKSIETRIRELHKVFTTEVKAEIDANARIAFQKGWVTELRLCPNFHPVKLWEHFYDTHGKGNQMGNVLDVTIARVAESANTIYQNHYYYRECTPDGRELEMVDKEAWRMLREHVDLLLRLTLAKSVRNGLPASSVRTKGGGGGGGGGGGSRAAIMAGGGAASTGAGGAKEVSARAVQLCSNVIGPQIVYGRPSEIKIFHEATGANGSTASKRGDEKS